MLKVLSMGLPSTIQRWIRKKTEFLVISSRQMARKIPLISLVIVYACIETSSPARNIELSLDTVDSHASMQEHVSNICLGAHFQLRNTARLRT